MSQSFDSRGAASADLQTSQLSCNQRRLIDLISRVHFGKIEGLHVRSGQPIFAPHPRVTRTLKVGGGANSNARNTRSRADSDDFALKAAVVELLIHIKHLDTGVVERIQVADGLPLLLEVCEPDHA